MNTRSGQHSIKLTKRLRYQQRLRNDLRNRFTDEFLSLLVHHEINNAGCKEVRVGDVMLIGCDNKNRLDWAMELVVEVFPGKDNSARVVKVKIRMGELKVETDQAIEEPAEIMHINQDSESNYEKSVRYETFELICNFQMLPKDLYEENYEAIRKHFALLKRHKEEKVQNAI
ncbi:hypothetical protein TNCV_3246191 [Trichonephila clavipes]|nr:hypothetical protein TNCV_3246191 [Trichonephila clavipes]